MTYKDNIKAAGLTASDLNAVVYFIKEKGDLSRWCDFEERKDAVRKALPDLWASLKRQRDEEQRISEILEKISNIACDLE